MYDNHKEIFKYYQKGIYEGINKIYAIGDIHGDFNAFILTLQKAELIDKNYNWCGGNAHVVQVGDILDRKIRDGEYTDEDSEVKIISMMCRLQLDSYNAGGGFHPVIGNHEIMNILGVFDYASPMGIKHFKNIEGRQNYFKIGNIFCKYLACGWNPIIKINNFIFCHGGISLDIAKKYTIQNINFIMRDTLYGNNKHMDNKYFSELFLDHNSILWNRKYSDNEEINNDGYKIILNELNNVLNIYNASYMVVGHTPQANGIQMKYNQKIICIDTAMSEAFGKKKNKLERIHFLEIDSTNNKILFY